MSCTPCPAAPLHGNQTCTANGTCDFDCALPYLKSGNTCVCGAACCANTDCPGGNTCVNGACVCGAACCADSDCPVGNTCVNGTCKAPPPTCDQATCAFKCFIMCGGMGIGVCINNNCICTC